MRPHYFLTIFSLFFSFVLKGQVANLIPTNTATHTAVQSGSWFAPTTWDAGTVPGDAAIVVIPQGISVSYQGCSNTHIFAIRVDGNFTCRPVSVSQKSCLRFDSFIGSHRSEVKFMASSSNDGNIEVIIAPFDIEAHKNGTSGFSQSWNNQARSHFSDGAAMARVEAKLFGRKPLQQLSGSPQWRYPHH